LSTPRGFTVAKIMLTTVTVAKMKPTGSRREIHDAGAPGLHLVIQTGGAKSWAMRFRRPDGKRAKLTLGPVDLSGKEVAGEPEIGMPLTLLAARVLAAEVARRRAQDVDVVAELRIGKQRRRVAIKESVTHAFTAVVRDFIDDYTVRKTGLKPRRWREDARMLGLDYPLDGGEPTIVKRGLYDRWRDKLVPGIRAE